MPNRVELTPFPGFNPYHVEDFYGNRGWETELVKVSNVVLVPQNRGAALECGDGRVDEYGKKKLYGPRIFGQVNAVAALVTGGDMFGFIDAIRLVRQKGFAPGTHGAEHEGEGCGMYGLWRNDMYKTVDLHPLRISAEAFEEMEISPTQWIKLQMKLFGGKHFTLPGLHTEEALRWNPFMWLTEQSSTGKRFKVDDGFLAEEVDFERRNSFTAETVELLTKDKPEIRKIEILIP